MPLLEIKAVMENPALDRDTILRSQKKMLQLKKDRLNRLISSIDDILKGENEMDFAMFDKAEIEEMCRAIVENLKEEALAGITGEYGNLENFQKHFVENASDPSVQENFKKVVEWSQKLIDHALESERKGGQVNMAARRYSKPSAKV